MPWVCDLFISLQDTKSSAKIPILKEDFGEVKFILIKRPILHKFEGNTDIPMHVGIAEVANVSVSPNPARSSLKVQTENVDVESLQLLDLNARVLKTCEATNVMQINEIPTGVYVLVIQLNNGKTYRKKIMKVE